MCLHAWIDPGFLSLADAIDRGEIVVASKWGAEPDWN